MQTLQYDLGYLRAALSILEEYLLSTELYWLIGGSPPSGEPAYPSLTLGGVLLAQSRVHAHPATNEVAEQVTLIDEQIHTLRGHWRSAWEHKAEHEFHARLNLWRDFLEEYRKNPDANLDRYAYEVGRRVMLELLKPEAGAIPRAELELYTGLDGLLRAVLIPGAFIWEQELAPGFPKTIYWYLYGRLKG